MKKTLLPLISVAILASMFLFSSCGHKQRVKMIPASHVKLSGEHKDLFRVAADSVKVMLVKTADYSYEVRALVPLCNTAAWSDLTGDDPQTEELLDPRMSDIKVYFTDQYGSDIKEVFNGLDIDHSALESILRSNRPTTEDVLIKDKSTLWGNKDYRVKKKTFDNVDGIVISQINITPKQGPGFDETLDRIERVLNVAEKVSLLGL